MDRITANMKKTMEEMLANSGYVANITIGKECYTAKLAVSMSGEMTLKYPHTLNPGQVVFEIKRICEAINGRTA